jgi:hypothetical protein
LDDLIIAVGRTVNSFSGGFNTMATLVVQSFSIFDMTEGAYTDTDTSGVIEDAEKTAQVSVF